MKDFGLKVKDSRLEGYHDKARYSIYLDSNNVFRFFCKKRAFTYLTKCKMFLNVKYRNIELYNKRVISYALEVLPVVRDKYILIKLINELLTQYDKIMSVSTEYKSAKMDLCLEYHRQILSFLKNCEKLAKFDEIEVNEWLECHSLLLENLEHKLNKLNGFQNEN